MRVWRALGEVDDTVVADGAGSVVTIGNFDGVHRGHQQVIGRVVARAHEIGGTSVVTTFDPHPMTVIHPDSAPLQLTGLDRRLDLIEYLGVDAVLVLPFDRELSLREPGEFVREVLVDALHAAEVHVGENFRFGHRAAGTVDTLRAEGAALGFDVQAVPLAGDTARWSSTYVRQCIAEGDTLAAAARAGTAAPGRGAGGRGRQARPRAGLPDGQPRPRRRRGDPGGRRLRRLAGPGRRRPDARRDLDRHQPDLRRHCPAGRGVRRSTATTSSSTASGSGSSSPTGCARR